ncbi:HTH domain-containing protein, partial [uncultured Nostoc sp.]|uniref:HTH domain-containing protein n=1 Tax=uncultured Nostoc sp. TaxID=340711 RepID=UPI0035C9542C
MSRHLERLLQIDSLLRTTTRPTTLSLAEALKVSERTVRSDLAFLRDRFNAPLELIRKENLKRTKPYFTQ